MLLSTKIITTIYEWPSSSTVFVYQFYSCNSFLLPTKIRINKNIIKEIKKYDCAFLCEGNLLREQIEYQEHYVKCHF